MTNEMFHYDEDMANAVFEYCRKRLMADPVPLDFSGDKTRLDAALEGLIAREGNDARKVLEIFADVLAPAVISCDSPRFLAFIPAAPTRASMLFDMVVSCSSLQGTSWLEASGAIAAENQAIRVLADLAGLPEGAGGVFVSGGSAANLSALAVARDSAPGHDPVNRDNRVKRGRPAVAVSDQVHASVSNTLRLLDMDALVVSTEDHRLDGTSLARALSSSDIAAEVVAVVATAGTTNAGIVDDLASIAQVAREHNLWFHVDAAYGGAALFAPSARALFEGVQRADSLVIDPHKWLFAPFDCAGLIYRQPELARRVHSQKASYLDPIHSHLDWNPSDYAYQLTRRARGLALWFSLAVHGTDTYSRAVETVLETTRLAASRIAELDHLELVREPGLSIVLFRRKGWGAGDYDRWSTQLLRSQIGFVTPTTWEDETVARLAFLNPETTEIYFFRDFLSD